MDLNLLWQQVQELSAILAANRESTVGLVRRADEIRNRSDFSLDGQSGGGGEQANGDVTATIRALRDRITQLEAENEMVREENAALGVEREETNLLLQDHEMVLEKVMEGLRVYAHEHSVATINIHSSYNSQLQAERATIAALHVQEIENAARLTTLSRLLREAFQLETALEPEIIIQGLKAENIALRAALGIDGDFENGGEKELGQVKEKMADGNGDCHGQ